MVWTLTTQGVTEYAYASLRTDYKVDPMVIASETGALGAGTSSPETRSNLAPVVRIIGDRELTARVGQPLTLVAEVTDDGLPRRRRFGRPAAAAQRRRILLLLLIRQFPMMPPPRVTRRTKAPGYLRGRCGPRHGSPWARSWGCICPGSYIEALNSFILALNRWCSIRFR